MSCWQAFSVSEKWTIIGAIGSWAGAVMGVIAILIAVKAYIQPFQVKLKASMASGIVATQNQTFMVYTITVSNIGIRAVTIDSIMLSTKRKNYYIAKLEENGLLGFFSSQFPVLLEPGCVASMYFEKEKLDSELGILFEKNEESHHELVKININAAGEADIRKKSSFRVSDFLRR